MKTVYRVTFDVPSDKLAGMVSFIEGRGVIHNISPCEAAVPVAAAPAGLSGITHKEGLQRIRVVHQPTMMIDFIKQCKIGSAFGIDIVKGMLRDVGAKESSAAPLMGRMMDCGYVASFGRGSARRYEVISHTAKAKGPLP